MRPSTILLLSACLATAAAAKPTTEAPEPAAEEQALAELRAAVAAMREEMFRPGPLIPGWNAGGADPDSELIAAGADRHYFLLSGDGSKTVMILTARAIADFAPPDWRVVDSYGAATDAVERPTIKFTAISPRYVVAARSSGFRRDNIDCSDRVAHALLFELPGETLSEEDEMAPLMFRLMLLAGEGVTTCTRWQGSRAAGWTPQQMLPDGRSLPAFAEPGERLTIVPAAPIDELMRR